MQLTDDEIRELVHRPLFNLLSQIIQSVGQPMPRFYMQRPDGSMINTLDGANGCAAYVSRQLNVMDAVNNPKLIDGQHGTVRSTVRALEAAGWQEVDTRESPQPGDVIVWEKQRQVDGEHVHIGFSLGGGEAVSTNYIQLVVGRHPDNQNAEGGPRNIEQLLRYPWGDDEYNALAHLNVVDGSAI